MKALTPFAFAAALTCQSAFAVNKCTGPDGVVTYQDAACASSSKSAEKIRAQDNSPGIDRSVEGGAARSKLELARLQQRTAILSGINRGEPVIGMTTSQLAQAMGSPDRINAGNYNGRLHDQLIYHRNGRTLYVYTENGVVRSIQNTEGSHGSASASPANNRPCPTPLEIRNARTSANSITDNYWVQREKMELVRRMESCWR